jgi:hypothetical protein
MSDAMRKCAHEGCSCEIPEGQTYCGPFCATAAAESAVNHERGSCECGHDSCKAKPGAFS